jgi:hypothetical protein
MIKFIYPLRITCPMANDEMILRQKYAQILMGYLTEAIIQRQKEKAREEKHPLSFGKLEGLVLKIEEAFGNFYVDSDLLLSDDEPAVSIDDLRLYTRVYARSNRIPFEEKLLEKVIKGGSSDLYFINTKLLGSPKIESSYTPLTKEPSKRLEPFIDTDAERAILDTLCCGQISRDLFSRGYLLSIVRKNDKVRFDGFFEALGSLMKKDVLKVGYSRYQNVGEIIYIHPSLDPLMIARAVSSYISRKGREIRVTHVETAGRDEIPTNAFVDLDTNLRKVYLMSETTKSGPKGL